MKPWFKTGCTLLLLLGLGGAGCNFTPAIPPDVPRELAPIPVTNRGAFTGSWANESFNLGPYRVTDVDRRTNISTGVQVAGHVDSGFRSDNARGGYSYAFLTVNGPIRGECSTEVGQQRLKLAGYNNDANDGRLGCRCVGGGLDAEAAIAGPGAAWTGPGNLHGWPTMLRAVDRYTNGSYATLPLAIDVRAPDGHLLAAVELKRPGTVWFSPSLDAQTHAELGCLMAGYLLFETPKSQN